LTEFALFSNFLQLPTVVPQRCYARRTLECFIDAGKGENT